MDVLITCKNEEDQIKNEGTSVGSISISRQSRAANSTVLGRMRPNFKLVRDTMAVLVTCKNEEDPIKSVDNIIHQFFRLSRGAKSAVLSQIWSNLELIRTLMVVLINNLQE